MKCAAKIVKGRIADTVQAMGEALPPRNCARRRHTGCAMPLPRRRCCSGSVVDAAAALVNEFDVEDLIVVDKRGGSSTFNRLDAAALSEWLGDYSLGELWKKNLLGGRPGDKSGPHAGGVADGRGLRQ